LKSKINVSLIDAITNITNSLGPNSTVFSASMQPERGYLVYQILALDDSNNIQKLLVDPANGIVLSQEQWPAGTIPGPLSSSLSGAVPPVIGPPPSEIPGLIR
jgi:hypothetical protein